jgi:hypothetical protein
MALAAGDSKGGAESLERLDPTGDVITGLCSSMGSNKRTPPEKPSITTIDNTPLGEPDEKNAVRYH